MRQKLLLLFSGLAGLFLAVPAFAQSVSGGAGAGGAASLGPVGVGLGMGLAAGLCGLGQGKAAASACEGVARNPGARPAIQLFVILALIFIESLTLYALAMVYIKIH